MRRNQFFRTTVVPTGIYSFSVPVHLFLVIVLFLQWQHKVIHNQLNDPNHLLFNIPGVYLLLFASLFPEVGMQV